ESQLLDAVSVGQFTPGPVFTAATFVGYLLGGSKGAGLATLGIFLPSFVFVALTGQWIERVRESPRGSASLDGVIVAALALMAAVCVQLARATLFRGWWPDVVACALAVVAFVVLRRFRVNSAWVILAGCGVGAALKAAGA